MLEKPMLTYILGASLIIMLASLVGKLTTVRVVGPLIERNLSYLVSFSAGVFTVITVSLGLEAFEESSSPLIAVSFIVGGFILLYIISLLLPESHHHHETSNPEDTHLHVSGKRILLSDALHNAGDGFLLAPAFFVSIELGIATTLAILIHELAQEVSEFFVLRQAGYSTRTALALNFIVSSSVLIGAVGGFLLAQSSAVVVGPLLGFAAGAFLYVVSRDLIPHSVAISRREQKMFPHALAWLVGVLFFAGISVSMGHSHTEDGHRELSYNHPQTEIGSVI